jgi:1,4-dihydroxy-2-naphthoate octaprenyltransferase
MTGLAYVFLVIQVVLGNLPAWCLIALATAPLNAAASRALLRDAARPWKLVGAIKLTIAAANLNGLLLAVGLLVSAYLTGRG